VQHRSPHLNFGPFTRRSDAVGRVCRRGTRLAADLHPMHRMCAAGPNCILRDRIQRDRRNAFHAWRGSPKPRFGDGRMPDAVGRNVSIGLAERMPPVRPGPSRLLSASTGR
jgi:hypothetical protein